MLTFDKITLRRGDFTLHADFHVKEGTKTAIIGPSGAGKSTLLDLVSGFLAPASGNLLWQGQDITDAPPGDRPLSLLFQDNNLFPHLTIAQNIGLGLRPNLRLSTAEETQVQSALTRVGLTDMGPRKPAALSGGQQSRAALARVLLRAKPLLLLDEPFSALGPALKAEMLDLLEEVLSETKATLLMVTHDPKDALRIADQTILVADGQAQPPQDTKPLFNNPPQMLKNYLG